MENRICLECEYYDMTFKVCDRDGYEEVDPVGKSCEYFKEAEENGLY